MKLYRGQWDLEEDEETNTTVEPDTDDTDDKTRPLTKPAEEESVVKSFTTTFATVLTGVANTLETAHRFQNFDLFLTCHTVTFMTN